jgi:uncharacterized membrane protein YhhN
MIQYYLAIILSIAALVGATLHVRASLLGLSGRVAVPRPAVMALVVLIALLAPEPVDPYYKGGILFGLLVSLVADGLATIPGNPRITVVGLLLIAYFVYLTVFASETALGWPTPWLLALILYGALLYWQIAPGLREMKGTILLYMALLGLMTWQALEMALFHGQVWSALAFTGAIGLVLASSIEGFSTYRTAIRGGTSYAVAAYLIAQWLLAASVWGGAIIPT